MAIQNRRGVYSDFTPSKMVPGELAVVNSGDPNSTSGKAVYVSFQDGQAKRLVMQEDVQNEIAKATEDIAEDLTQQIETAVADDVQAAQTAASNASTSASTASTKANEAAASATQAAQTVANIIDNTLTQTGKAADAKKTGDEITSLKGDLNNIETDIEDIYLGKPIEVSGINKLNPADIKQNTFINHTGTESSYTGLDATGYINVVSDKSSIAFTCLNYTGTSRVCLPVNRILFYNSEKTVVSYVDSVPSQTVTSIPSNAVFARLVVESSYISDRQPMVEFVNAKEDISSTFVQYEEVTERDKGLNELIDDVDELENIPSDLEELSETVSDLSAQVVQNTSSIAEILGNAQTIDTLATFSNGGINSQTGAFNNYYVWRVATQNIVTLTKKVAFAIENGFRLYVAHFLNGVFQSAGWVSDGTVLDVGEEVRLMIARTSESESEVADVTLFCSKVTYVPDGSLSDIEEQLDENTTSIANINAVTTYGMTWDWWITSHSVDKFGNSYIGYVDTDGYAGIIRRQPDGIMQYKRLEKLYNDDDHNALATIVLDSGKILVIGSYGHTVNNHIVCWRSKTAYSIDDMEQLSFDITGNGYTYKTCYSQVFKYNGVLFDFLRFGSIPTGGSSTFGYACLISANNGETWTAYKVFNGTDAYNAMAQCTDNDRYLKVVVGENPSAGNNTFVGCYIDLSTYKIYDLNGTQIGTMVPLNGGSIADSSCAQKSSMTSLIAQTISGQKGRLFFTANTELADTVFLYATATDRTDADFIYKVYNNGTVTEIGHSGTPFGNGHYISGACFGKEVDTIYYAKATTEKADGAHELHKVKLSNGSVQSDSIITEANMCILRPLFLGNGELATVVGHYNDQNSDGTYNGSFTAWELKPLFMCA